MAYHRTGDNYVIYCGHNVSTRLGKATNKTKQKNLRDYTTSCTSHLLPVLTFRLCGTVPHTRLFTNEYKDSNTIDIRIEGQLLILLSNVKAEIPTNLWKTSHVFFENPNTLKWINLQNKRIHLFINNENDYLPSPLSFKFLQLILVFSSFRTFFCCFSPQQMKPTNNA